MKTSSIKYNAYTQKGIRFDASFHLSDGLVTKRLIESSPYPLKTIGDVSSRIFFGNRAKRVYVTKKENGIPFLSSSDILRSDLENVKLASKKYMPVSDMKLETGWTLISRSGTIGNCAFANAKHAQKLASEHVIRLVPNNILRGGLVYAYLASKYGYSLLTQGTFGAVIQHIEPDFVSSIPIPSFPEDFQNKINDLVLESARLREEAASSLDEAHSIIEGILRIRNNKTNNRVAISSIAKDAMIRFEASYYLSEAMSYENLIKTFGYHTLDSICSRIFGGGRARRYYTKDRTRGVPYLSNSDLGKANPLRSCKYSLKSKVDVSSILRKGMIVTGRVGAIGQTQYIGESFEKMQTMGSDNVIRIVPKEHSGFLFAYLSSKVGNCMFWKYATGGVQPFISSEMVGQILVPILPNEIIEKCDALIKNYSDSIELASITEDLAISLVEQEIEKWNK